MCPPFIQELSPDILRCARPHGKSWHCSGEGNTVPVFVKLRGAGGVDNSQVPALLCAQGAHS